jgi:hypothetical protein
MVGKNSTPCTRTDVDTSQAVSRSLFSSKCTKKSIRQLDNVVVKQSLTVVATNAPQKDQQTQSLYYDIVCRAEQIIAEESLSKLDLSEFFAELQPSAVQPPSLTRCKSVDSFDSVKFYRRRAAKKNAIMKKDMQQ